jgi:DNA (cytosine-5)-methyltransferase 1
MEPRLNCVELFAGAGGLAMGIEKCGFRPLRVVEWDADACATLRFNASGSRPGQPDWPVREGDVRHMDFKDLAGKVDLVSGGPPCQPFSIGGKHRAFLDERDMFPQAARVVLETAPKAFIFENVRGLARKSFESYFNYVLLRLQYPELIPRTGQEWRKHLAALEEHHLDGTMKGLHYKLVWQLVNAADYGVPQKRERVIIVGFRSDIHLEWSFPRATHCENELWREKHITGAYWEQHGLLPPYPAVPSSSRTAPLSETPVKHRWLTVRDALAGLPDPRSREAKLIANHKYQPGAKIYPGHTGSPMDEPAKTLKAGDHGVPGGENMMVQPNGQVRYFTVRESARLQTFPDAYVFPGSWTESMRQIGNAVPVRLAGIIGKSVASALRGQIIFQRKAI